MPFSWGGGGCGSGGQGLMFVATGVLFIYPGMVDDSSVVVI